MLHSHAYVSALQLRWCVLASLVVFGVAGCEPAATPAPRAARAPGVARTTYFGEFEVPEGALVLMDDGGRQSHTVAVYARGDARFGKRIESSPPRRAGGYFTLEDGERARVDAWRDAVKNASARGAVTPTPHADWVWVAATREDGKLYVVEGASTGPDPFERAPAELRPMLAWFHDRADGLAGQDL
jgi:hypothetical protein